MRIGINALFRGEQLTGVGTYIRNLIHGLSLIDTENEYFIFSSSVNNNFLTINQDNFQTVLCDVNANYPARRRLWEHFNLSRLTQEYNIDVTHCLLNTIPLVAPHPCVVTVMDTQYFYFPAYYAVSRYYYNKWFMKHSVKNADQVIAISRSTKDDIERFLGRPRRPVKVIHFGVEEVFNPRPEREINLIKREIGLRGPYLLFIGVFHPRKNLPALIESWKIALSNLSPDYQLVIAGLRAEKGRETDAPKVFKLIREMDLEKNVKILDYVAPEKLPALMSGAEALVFPSLQEGFGLPVLEAMACGVPVIASDIPALREVAGDAGRFINPNDIFDIARGISEVATSEDIRSKLKADGLQRARNFSWINTARETLACYKDLAENPGVNQYESAKL